MASTLKRCHIQEKNCMNIILFDVDFYFEIHLPVYSNLVLVNLYFESTMALAYLKKKKWKEWTTFELFLSKTIRILKQLYVCTYKYVLEVDWWKIISILLFSRELYYCNSCTASIIQTSNYGTVPVDHSNIFFFFS